MASLAERLAGRTLELVDIPSESRHEEAIREHLLSLVPVSFEAEFAGEDAFLFASPRRPGAPLVVLVGHYDTVPAQGNVPGRIVDGRVYVIEKGVLVTGPDLNGSFGLYNEQNQHERFRVSLRQSSDAATATVTYSRLTADCIPGNPCSEDVFWTSESLANYPLRVDTSFREANAILEKVVVVRIQNP